MRSEHFRGRVCARHHRHIQRFRSVDHRLINDRRNQATCTRLNRRFSVFRRQHSPSPDHNPLTLGEFLNKLDGVGNC